jgi:chorismate-pyruvate lyase
MMKPAPQIEDLFALFPGTNDLPSYRLLPAEQLPSPYRELLAHEQHMTVTVEAYHGGPVDVQVLEDRLDGDEYSRRIVLVHRASGRRVLFGIVQINLRMTSPDVRQAILARREPLGHILIAHDVLRRIEPIAYVAIEPGPKQLAWFGLHQPQPLYGRLAIIHCDEQPAVELFEAVV